MFHVRRLIPVPLAAALATPALLLSPPPPAPAARQESDAAVTAVEASAPQDAAAALAVSPIRRAIEAVLASGADLGGVESASFSEASGVAMVVMERGTAVHHIADGSTTIAGAGVIVDMQSYLAPLGPGSAPAPVLEHEPFAMAPDVIDLTAAGAAAKRILRV